MHCAVSPSIDGTRNDDASLLKMFPTSTSSAAATATTATTHYAAKKRRRPQIKKDKDAGKAETKSNPSKRHRDRLNLELDNLAKLIPFSDDVINKLDKLSILRLAVSYLRNKSYYTAEENANLSKKQDLPRDNQLQYKNQSNQLALASKDAKLSLQALNGFIVVVTQSFNIFYVSETIQELLGFPQCDVINSSMLDLIHADDRHIFMKNMRVDQKGATTSVTTEPPKEGEVPEYSALGIPAQVFRELSSRGMMHRSFICRLRCLIDNSSGFLALHFTGHIRLLPGQRHKSSSSSSSPSAATASDTETPELGIFLLATPLETPSILEIRTKNFIFRTKHHLDYTPLGIDAKGRVVLGYTEHQLRQRSGYEFVHSADMMHCADAHTKLMRRGESGMTVFRILHKENKWLWVTASAKLVYRNGRPEYIVSTHRPIPDQEGMEHMKKRSVQFRFDFNGQAVLYGQVNPVGTNTERNKAPPSPQPQQQQPQKKQSISTCSTSSSPGCQPMETDSGQGGDSSGSSSKGDQLTLFEAQSMQSDSIYSGEAHKDIFDDIYNSVTTGVMPLDPGNSDLVSLESNDFGTCYYNITPTTTASSGEFDDSELEQILPPDLDFAIGVRKQQQQQHEPMQVYDHRNVQMDPLHSESPEFFLPPQKLVLEQIGAYFSADSGTDSINQQQQPMQCNQAAAASKGSLKRSYPYSTYVEGSRSAKISPKPPPQLEQSKTDWPQSSQFEQQQPPIQNQTVQQQQSHLNSTWSRQQQQLGMNNNVQQQQTKTNYHTQQEPGVFANSNYQYNQRSQQQQQPSMHQNMRTPCYSNNKRTSSLQQPISSTMMTQTVHADYSVANGDLPHYSPPDAGWNNINMVGYEQSTTKFNLEEIAVRYQTTDPISKARDLMEANDQKFPNFDAGAAGPHQHYQLQYRNTNSRQQQQQAYGRGGSGKQQPSGMMMSSSSSTGSSPAAMTMSVSPPDSSVSGGNPFSVSPSSASWDFPPAASGPSNSNPPPPAYKKSVIPHK